MLTITERTLTPAEVRSLAGRINQARRESRVALVKTGVASLFAGGGLGSLTVVGSGSSSWVIVFWLVAAIMIGVWIALPKYLATRQHIASLDDAMRASRVKVTRAQSSRVVEFEDTTDDACYAFEVDASTCLFIVGREFHQDDFPNSDFSIVELLGVRGRPVDSMLEKAGRRLTPERVVPASVRRLVEIPEHLTTLRGAIEQVEHELARPRGRGYA